VRVWSNDLDGAQADLAAVAALGEQASFLAYVNARTYLAEVAIRQGRLVEAAGLAEAVFSVTDDADAPWLAPLPAAVAAFALAVQGDTDGARTFATAATAVADATDLAPARMWSEHAWLRIAAAEGAHEQVTAIGDRMLRQSWEALPEGILHWRAAYTEALVATGRLDDAAAVAGGLAADVADVADGTDTSVRTEAYRAAAHVAAASGDHDAAEQAESAGLALDPTAARPFERAQLELAAGGRRRRSGRRRDAAGLLEAAAARFAAMGARPWLDRCDRELRATGLQPARRSTSDPRRELTPQETTVARLVADGRSNREVAAELVLSVKTVEHHLTRIYTKLGVRSRTELAARILQRTADL
jgi:DNA-binding CsgD family transcriptional regulator